jgi:hypothetical protein
MEESSEPSALIPSSAETVQQHAVSEQPQHPTMEINADIHHHDLDDVEEEEGEEEDEGDEDSDWVDFDDEEELEEDEDVNDDDEEVDEIGEAAGAILLGEGGDNGDGGDEEEMNQLNELFMFFFEADATFIEAMSLRYRLKNAITQDDTKKFRKELDQLLEMNQGFLQEQQQNQDMFMNIADGAPGGGGGGRGGGHRNLYFDINRDVLAISAHDYPHTLLSYTLIQKAHKLLRILIGEYGIALHRMSLSESFRHRHPSIVLEEDLPFVLVLDNDDVIAAKMLIETMDIDVNEDVLIYGDNFTVFNSLVWNT